MWKRDEAGPDQPGAPTTVSTPRKQTPPLEGPSRARASIGTSITIRGEVTGDEDLFIEGRVDGSVDLKQHAVTVGSEGQVKAGIAGRVVTVEGTVFGDLWAHEMVVLRSGAHVQGDITAPRVVLEDGATFRGAVDMGDKSAESRGSVGTSADKPSSSKSAKTRSDPDPTASQDKGEAGAPKATAVSP